MARVRQKGTRAELTVASVLRDLGVHYRLNVRSLPGSPDFANKSRRWAIFVHGCFWHRHPGCSRATTPKTNIEFWAEKFRANRARDERACAALEHLGYRVLLVWECETTDTRHLERRISEVLEAR